MKNLPTAFDMEVHERLDIVAKSYVDADPSSILTVRAAIIDTVKCFHGLTEIGKTNTGYWIDKFEKDLGMHGKAWCLAFIQWVLFFVSQIFKKPDLLPYNTAACVPQYQHASKVGLVVRTFEEIDEADLVVWRDGTKPLGHIGCVTSVAANAITTMEGNTSNADYRNGGAVEDKCYTKAQLAIGKAKTSERWCMGVISIKKLHAAYWGTVPS